MSRDPESTGNAASVAAPYRETMERLLASLNTDREKGLSAEESRKRLEQHGRNELAAEPARPAWKKFLAQFKDVLVILLLIATADSARDSWM
jgi:P-type Ca2+ transporter type 2C